MFIRRSSQAKEVASDEAAHRQHHPVDEKVLRPGVVLNAVAVWQTYTPLGRPEEIHPFKRVNACAILAHDTFW